MRGYDHSTTVPPRKWALRGIFLLLALFALMEHSIVHSGKVSATGVSPVAIAVYGQGNYTFSSANTGTEGLADPHAVALDSNDNLYVADKRTSLAPYLFSSSREAEHEARRWAGR